MKNFLRSLTHITLFPEMYKSTNVHPYLEDMKAPISTWPYSGDPLQEVVFAALIIQQVMILERKTQWFL